MITVQNLVKYFCICLSAGLDINFMYMAFSNVWSLAYLYYVISKTQSCVLKENRVIREYNLMFEFKL